MREPTINAVSAYPSLQKGTYLSSSWLLSQCSASAWSCHACCSPQHCLLPAWKACRAFLSSSHPQLVSTSVWGLLCLTWQYAGIKEAPRSSTAFSKCYLTCKQILWVQLMPIYRFICWERVSLDSPGRVQTFFAVLKFAFLFPGLQNVEVSRLCHLTQLLLNLFIFHSGAL